MADDPKKQPIIIKKKKGGHAGFHGGAWKLAYADFVTAMMAFFLVMWIVGLDVKTRAGLAEYFNNPGAFKVNYQSSPYVLNLDGRPPLDQAQVEQSARENFNVDVSTAERLVALVKSVVNTNPRFKDLRPWVDAAVTEQGVRIDFMEGPKGTFFEPGKYRFRTEARVLVQEIAAVVIQTRRRVSTEGHTDARPEGERGGMKWQLGSDRANALLREMQAMGLTPGQIGSVDSKGSTMLKKPNEPLASDNNRVSMVIKY